jgi:hypothetical protein
MKSEPLNSEEEFVCPNRTKFMMMTIIISLIIKAVFLKETQFKR